MATKGALPEGMVLHKSVFRQADFIEVAIHNVSHALRDGALLVVFTVLLFLLSLRATLITALAIPLGVWAATRHGRPADLAIMGVTQLGIAVPNFWFGMILVLFLALGRRPRTGVLVLLW